MLASIIKLKRTTIYYKHPVSKTKTRPLCTISVSFYMVLSGVRIQIIIDYSLAVRHSLD